MTISRWQQNNLFFAETKSDDNGSLVWCSFAPVVADNPVMEAPDQTVWFQFAQSREEAVSLLLKEVYPGDR
jgi:hypothetical protein